MARGCKKWVEIGSWACWSFSIQFVRLVFVMSSISVMVPLRQDGIVYHLEFKVRHIRLLLLELSVGGSIVLVNISMGWAQGRSNVEVTAGCIEGRWSESWLLRVKRVALLGVHWACQDIYPLRLDVICCVLSQHIWLDDPWGVSIGGSLNVSVTSSKHLVLVLMSLLHLLFSDILGLWHIGVGWVVEQHGSRCDRLNCLLNTMVNSIWLVCSVCGLVIKCLFQFILFGVCQRREAEFGGHLGEVLRPLDLSVGHKPVTLLINSICYNASGLNQVLDVMMWLRFFLVDLLQKVVSLSRGSVVWLDNLPTFKKFEWLGFIYVLYLIL